MGGKHINTRMASLTKVANLVESQILFCDTRLRSTFEKDCSYCTGHIINFSAKTKLNNSNFELSEHYRL